MRDRIDFTQPYYLTPARFAVRKDAKLADATPSLLVGKVVGVIAGSAHEAYLKTFFSSTKLKTFPQFAALHEALTAGAVDAIFADGLTTEIWLAGESSGATPSRRIERNEPTATTRLRTSPA